MNKENPMFPELTGIEKERDVKERRKSSLEYLLEISDNIVKTERLVRPFPRWYMEIYTRLQNELLANIEFDNDDLRNFIFAKANNDDQEESHILGLYSGCLLHLLTERNKAKGRRTQFYINGQGNRFDYLFWHAREVDELIVDNFKGDLICCDIGSYGGNAGSVMVINNIGYLVASYVGSHHGNVGWVIAVNNEGLGTACYVGSHDGNANLVIAINNKGRYDISGIGAGGNVKRLVVYNIIQKYISESVKVEELIEGEKALQEYGEIIKLAESMKGKSDYREILKVARGIYESLKIEPNLP